jgi:hypothetical protein
VHLKAVCQAAVIIVANRGIGERKLIIERNPHPAIVHREILFEMLNIFEARPTSEKLICGALFRL